MTEEFSRYMESMFADSIILWITVYFLCNYSHTATSNIKEQFVVVNYLMQFASQLITEILSSANRTVEKINRFTD